MDRCRWLNAEWPIGVRQLGRLMAGRRFDHETGQGFIVGRVRDSFIEAKYVERVQYTERLVDPFGIEHEVQHLEYRQSSFRASDEPLGLEIYDAPRSSRLLAELQEVCDFELVVTEVEADVMKWAGKVSKTVGIRASVCSVQVGDLALAKDVKARVLVSGNGDVRDSTNKLIGARKGTTEKVNMRFESVTGVLQLSRPATARFPAGRGEELLPFVRNAIYAQIG